MNEDKHTSAEDGWFLQHERELIEQSVRERERRLQAELKEGKKKELKKLRKSHWMKCPRCGHDMESIKTDNVSLNQCTFCGGIFFPRDEVEGLVLRPRKQRHRFFRWLFGLS